MANLPHPGDPLMTLNGAIAPINQGDPLETVSYSTREVLPDFKKFNPSRKMGIRETPEKDAQDQTLAAAIIGLRLMGLEPSDIALMFKTSIIKINEVIEKPATQLAFEKMFMSIINTNADHIAGRIASYGNEAVDRVYELMQGGEKVPAIVSLKAAQDILDRSGTGADQMFGVNNKQAGQEDELKITYVTKDGGEEKINVSLKRT